MVWDLGKDYPEKYLGLLGKVPVSRCRLIKSDVRKP